MSKPPRVSVVSPVYNASRFLPRFIETFLEQTLPAEDLELIVVDDGSTDGSGELLDEYADKYDHITVIHQENSGWPGKPRNVGIEAARGDYIFFADPDDELGGSEALARLADFADEHGSDVVVPKMVPKGARRYAQWRYATTQVDADLVTCFTTLTPQKLFRRKFLESEYIRFPEEKVRLEDGQFLSRAYLLAERVSILAGYDFYRLVRHPGQKHLTNQAPDPVNYIGSVSVICGNVEELCDDSDLADRIIDEVYVRKVQGNFVDSKLAKHNLDRRQAWLNSQRPFVERFITPSRYEKLDEVARVRTDLIRAGDVEAILDYARRGRVDFTVASAASSRGTVEIRGTISDEFDATRIVLDERDGDDSVRVPIEYDRGDAVIRLSKAVLPRPEGMRRYDLFVDPGPGHQNRRIRDPSAPSASTSPTTATSRSTRRRTEI